MNLKTQQRKSFKKILPESRNININNTTKSNLYENTVISARSTNPNKTSKNRSKSYEYTKSQKTQLNQGAFTKSSIRKLRIHSLDLRREVDDPQNEHVRDEIERVIHFYKQIDQLNSDFNSIEKYIKLFKTKEQKTNIKFTLITYAWETLMRK